jgi:hypothetical protein
MPYLNFQILNIVQEVMVHIISTWRDNTLIINAHDHVKTPPETVIKMHTKEEYGKVLGTDYTKFQIDGDLIRCTFQQKFAFKKFDMNFVKRITRNTDSVDIKFKTVNSMVDLRGKWTITPMHHGSKLTLVQKTDIPRWARWLPGVEHLITGKITRIFEHFTRL